MSRCVTFEIEGEGAVLVRCFSIVPRVGDRIRVSTSVGSETCKVLDVILDEDETIVPHLIVERS
jgi:hypothetical protein